MSYFLTYVLGYISPSNQKADIGTITHKVLEILANIKKCKQDKKYVFDDDCIGKIQVPSDEEFLKPYILSEEEVAKFNKDVSAKTIYKSDSSIKNGHTRLGVHFVDDIFNKVYEYYVNKFSHHTWTNANRKQAYNMVWIELDYLNGAYDPRKRNIIAPEPHFDITLDEDWAEYSFVQNGEPFSGNLEIKGTIDLVTEVDSDTIEVVDFKTGQRLDWADKNTAKKDYKRLCEDTQLMLYYYAIRKMYPQYKYVILTIFFIRDGGPFSIPFDDSTIDAIKNKIKKMKQEVESCELPEMISPSHSDFRCKTLCHFFKTKWPNTEISVCDFIHKQIKHHGIEKVSDALKSKTHTMGKYQNPGG